ncbi:hypothetical protein CA984_40225 [Streptosporangium minutum]|uniref:Uncharacterized protein n=2 Tax=Streptosporangium minutum TaxID=569862 RepID=A0A243QQL7_9ACTN|nr:hypothetical protein CA984_40225 [Streptosporangium minutum]
MIMTSDNTARRGSTALGVLGVIWFIGTPLSAYLAFVFGFALAGAEAKNAQLAEVLAITALGLGLGTPVVGLFIALALNNKGGMWAYGVIVAAIGTLIIVIAPKDSGSPIYREDLPVCTAPPDKEAGVPGC